MVGQPVSKQGPSERQKHRETASPPQEERLGSAQKSVKCGDSKWGHTPEIKTIGHRLGEHRVLMETGETEGIDCFSVRAR